MSDLMNEQEITTRIDPTLIGRSKWTNRHDQSFSDEAFIRLKTEIHGARGNIQPIKVRPLTGQDGKYEIVFGHRRHQACLELGLPVLAMIENVNEQELFTQMDRENRERKDLRPYEQGLMYARALDEGLFASARKLGESLGVDLSNLGKALSIARLPSKVLDSFNSPLDIQYRWERHLARALMYDPDAVLQIADEIQAESPRPDSKSVFQRLIRRGGTVPPPKKTQIKLVGRGGVSGTFNIDEANKSASMNLKNIDPDKAKKIQRYVAELLSSSI